MTPRSVLAAIGVGMLLSLAGCAMAPADTDADDVSESVTSASLSESMGDSPMPLDHPTKGFDGTMRVPSLRPGDPTGDGVVDAWEPIPPSFGGCQQIIKQVYLPGRERPIEIRITQCY